MSATVYCGAGVLFLALSAACGSSAPTSPTGTSPSSSGTLLLPGLTPQPSVTPLPSVITYKLSSLVWSFAHLHIRACRLWGRRVHARVELRPLR